MKTFSRYTLALLFTAVFIFLSVDRASAGIARVESMGMDGDSYWAIQKDEAYIFYNPAYLSQFTPQIYADPVNEIGGLILNPATNFNLYLLTGRPLIYLDYPGYDFQGDPGNAPLTKEQLNAMASIDMGTMALGFNLSYSSTMDSDDTARTDYSRSVINAGFGFLMDLSQGNDIDGALSITSWDIKDEAAGATTYEASTYDLSLLARFNMAISEISKLHIFGSFQRLDRSLDTPEVDDTYMIIILGVSDEMNITKSTIVYAGAGIGISKESMSAGGADADVDDRYLKVGAGVETGVTENLTARFGFNRYWYNYEKTETTESDTEMDPDPNFAFGIGYKLGNVVLDWQIAQSLIQDGPYFISGVGSDYSVQFEVRYNFETATADTTPIKKK